MEIFNHLEDDDYKDQKLSFIERSLILATIPIIKILCWKLKRVRTYGDLMKLGNLIKDKLESLEEKYENETDMNDVSEEEAEQQVKKIIDDLEEFNKELKDEKGSEQKP